MLHNCWEMEPQKRPGWTKTIETLKVELQLHPSCLDPPRRWHFGFLLTTEGSCSTGLLMTEGQGMLGLATFQGPLPIEEEAQEGGCRLEGNCNLGSGCPRMTLQSKEATC